MKNRVPFTRFHIAMAEKKTVQVFLLSLPGKMFNISKHSGHFVILYTIILKMFKIMSFILLIVCPISISSTM